MHHFNKDITYCVDKEQQSTFSPQIELSLVEEESEFAESAPEAVQAGLITGIQLQHSTVPCSPPKHADDDTSATTTETSIMPEDVLSEFDDSKNESDFLMDVNDNTKKEASELTPTGAYFRCLGQLHWSSEKIAGLVSNVNNKNHVHLKSGFTEIIDSCDKVAAMIDETKKLATDAFQALECQSVDEPDMLERNILIDHDPAKRPSTLTNNQKRYLVNLGPCQPKLTIYPRNQNFVEKGKQYSFSQTWFEDYPYLEYSISKNKAYCFVCSIFGKHCFPKDRSEKAWVEGIDDWSKMKGSRGKNKPGKLETHFSSNAHAAALRVYTSFVRESEQVDVMLTKQQRKAMLDSESDKAKNREVIEILFDVVKTLTRNGLPLRGNSNDEDGNFHQIVKLLSRHNSVMKSWLASRSTRKYHATYLSPESQNEFISLLGEEVRNTISSCVKESGFCTVMADTTPDVSHKDEISVAVRYVDVNTCKPRERLVRIAESLDKTGVGQAEEIVKCLKLSNIPLSTVMFQTYDSTASMSGKFNGAQQKMCELLERRIPYTKCTPHGVNLVVEHGCSSSPLIGKTFAVMEQLFVFFTNSPKKHHQLIEEFQDVENYLQLRNLSKTRWSARAESVEAVWRGLNAILKALDKIKESGERETKTKASGLINAIVNVDFICGVMFLKNVMPKTKLLSDYLQGEQVDIAGALIAIDSTQDCLTRIRSADKEIDDQIQASMQVARNIGADPVADFLRLHRIRRPSRRLDERPESTAVELGDINTYYRTEFFKFIDQLCATLLEKRNYLEDTFDLFLKVLHPERPGSAEDVGKLISAFPTAFALESSRAIHSELEVFFEYAVKEHRREQNKRRSEGLEAYPLTYTTAAKIALKTAKNHGLFKQTAKVYKLFLTAAPSVVKNERSFSLMKIVKSHLRNKISGERLNDCMILAAESDITDAIDLTKLARKWSILKNRRLSIE